MAQYKPEQYQNITYCIQCGHKLILKNDREGKLRPQCPACEWIYYKNPIPAAAMLIMNEKQEVVIIERKFEPSAGEWALPSGYMEIVLSPEENAVEEMWEETGLRGEVERYIGYYFGASPIYERVLSHGYLMRVTGGELCAGDDAAKACYVPLESIPRLAFDSHRYFLREECKRRGLPIPSSIEN